MYIDGRERSLDTDRVQLPPLLSVTAMRRAGKLHFVKFETAKVEQVVDFIEAKGLLRPAAPPGSADSGDQRVSIKATGGGAFKFAELFEVLRLQSRTKPCRLEAFRGHQYGVQFSRLASRCAVCQSRRNGLSLPYSMMKPVIGIHRLARFVRYNGYDITSGVD